MHLLSYRLLSRVVLLGLLITIFSTFQDYGISWDEIRQQNYGERIVLFYISGFQDLAALNYHDLAFYGGFFDTVAVLLQRAFKSVHPYELRHLCSALLGFLSIIGAGRLAQLLGGRPAKFWSVLLLACLPLYYGHMFINTKDIPFACGYVWSLYYLCKLIVRDSQHPYRLAVKLGVILGLTLATRIGAALFFFYFFLVASGFGLMFLKGDYSLRLIVTRKYMPLVIVSLTAYISMLPFWPYALLNPISGPLTAYQEMVKFRASGPVLIAGQYIEASNPPYWYLPHLIYVQLSEVLLFLVFAISVYGFAEFTSLFFKRWQLPITTKVLAWSVISTSIVFPICFAILKHSTLYDNFRHFLFVLPPIVILCSVFLGSAIKRLPMLVKPVVLVGMIAWILSYVRILVELHPYQYVYYNMCAEGVDAKEPRYQLDYWATGFKEAVQLLTNYVEAHPELDKPVLVSSSAPVEVMEVYLESHAYLQYTPVLTDARFHIALVTGDYNTHITGKRIDAVSRAGAVYVSIYDVKFKD